MCSFIYNLINIHVKYNKSFGSGLALKILQFYRFANNLLYFPVIRTKPAIVTLSVQVHI